ncbi:MAG: response regulator [Christensenellaceae bacterium]|jgi:putative two-component system response regulator|nr:response regulator [Christensenellaceae bacterium]
MANERKTIFLVDDNATNLTLGKEMLKAQYKVYPVLSAGVMFDLLDNIMPDMILLDIEMPEMDGYEALKKLKDNRLWADIPVIFLTVKVDEGSELHGLSLGAIDYVSKPFSAPLLLKRIENHLLIEQQKKALRNVNDHLEDIVKQRTAQVINLQNTILSAVADLVEFRDDVTGGHVSRSQAFLSILIDLVIEARVYVKDVAKWNMNYIVPSAQLHDVGKIAISDIILNKPGKLTPEEFEIMKTHAQIGAQFIKQIEGNGADDHDFLRHARLIAGGHHEKWDGSGYPMGLKGEDIPLEARIMAIADVYDALVSARPYKRPLSTDEAKTIIVDGRGTHFDPILVDLFVEASEKFAEVVRNYGAK